MAHSAELTHPPPGSADDVQRDSPTHNLRGDCTLASIEMRSACGAHTAAPGEGSMWRTHSCTWRGQQVVEMWARRLG